MHEFQLALLRQFRAAREEVNDQSGVMRVAVELFVGATEKVAEDLRLVREYEAWAAEDAEGDAFRAGALEAGAPIWREA